MKNYLKILILLIGIFIIIGTTYAWVAGGGVKWIGNPGKSDRFEDHSSDTTYGTGYYLDTFTNLKWQTQHSGNMFWAKDNSYSEPIWNQNTKKYEYPSGRTRDDYYPFKYCELLGDGYWRLPTKNELVSIMTFKDLEKNEYNFYTKLPSISTKENNRGAYWSSIESINNDRVWVIEFNSNTVGTEYKIDDDTDTSTICVHD